MKKGTRLACVVGLASISLVAFAGGASAAKNKIGDREVTARNISNGSIHCRALDKYLKGHLCGPNASVKKAGVAGPQGPPGPPGPSGPGGATEVFYVASATNPQATVFQGGGLTIKADCDLADNLGLELVTTKTDGVLRTSAVTGDDNVEYNNLELDAGVIPAPFVFTEALLTLSYISPDGDVLTGTFQVDSQTNGAVSDTKDCVFAGHMNAS